MPKKSSSRSPRPASARRKRAVASKAVKRDPWTRSDGEVHGKGMLIGYARVSTLDQNLSLQRDALTEAGCQKICIEQMSGAVAERPALLEALDYARSGDTLVVWKLDRLARSMKQLIETVEKLRIRGIGFQSLTEFNRHDDRARGACVSHVQRLGRVRAQPNPRAHPRWPCSRAAGWPNRRTTPEAG